MPDVPRVELPSLLAQTEHAARIGAARATRVEHTERAETDFILELESQRAEEVQAAGEVTETGEQHKDHDPRGDDPRRHPDDDADEQERHVDVLA